jgi:hypothetical protein
MKFIRQTFLVVTLLFSVFGFSQKKKLTTQFTQEKINIDAKFNESAWQTVQAATDFVMLNPDNGKPETENRKSEVKVLYDHNAIYIAATLFDDNPQKISKEFTTRDNFATADHFGVFINGYNDGQQEFRFFVSAAGVQQDIIYTSTGGEDGSWDAIWDSHVEITEKGWQVEMRIPYAALRFSDDKTQTWGINFYREIIRDRYQYTWSLLDNKITNESIQAGILEGIQNIETPTRLFFIPYVSQYVNANDWQKTKGEFKGGMDIKYGINDAFTLDAILVPDFGQTALDNVTLNLSPFEQQFSENRPFFTEGTDLFTKGYIFYSRRIGGRPSLSRGALNNIIDANEEIEKYPAKINLLNALKISGRTKSGLGVGLLNAVTEKTFAEIRNTTTGELRNEVVEPLTNFSILALDQRFRKNSSISFVNTNVTRNGEFRDANVSALVWDLNTKKNSHTLTGNVKYSYINSYKDLENKEGVDTDIYFADKSGKYRYGAGTQYVSKNYNNNDLGINYQNHYHAFYWNASYRILKPTKKMNNFSTSINYYTEFDNKTDRIQSHNIYINIGGNTKKNNYYSLSFNIRPTTISDFYEPRTLNEEKYFTRPKNFSINPGFSSNYAKKFAIDFFPSYYFINEPRRNNYGLFISPRYRMNDKISFIYTFNFERQNNDRGYVDSDATNIYFTQRNVINYNNSLSAKYSINNVMNINLSLRHYWSYAVNKKYFTLQDDGSLLGAPTYTYNNDQNFATWNLDLSYSWWFAPGSQISLLYRNNSLNYDYGTDFNHQFEHNIKSLVNHEKLDHIFSINIRYFIDYNQAKHWFSKK